MNLAGDDTYTTLSAMITPAIFLTANASLIISTSNRVSRVVDRIRVLIDLSDKIGRGVSESRLPGRADGARECRSSIISRRGVIALRAAMTALYLAFSSFVGTSLTLAIDDWLRNRLGALPTLLAIVGVGLMLFASINLVREASVAGWQPPRDPVLSRAQRAAAGGGAITDLESELIIEQTGGHFRSGERVVLGKKSEQLGGFGKVPAHSVVARHAVDHDERRSSISASTAQSNRRIRSALDSHIWRAHSSGRVSGRFWPSWMWPNRRAMKVMSKARPRLRPIRSPTSLVTAYGPSGIGVHVDADRLVVAGL